MTVDRAEYLRAYNKKKWAESPDTERHAAWRMANKEKRNAYARKWHAEKRATDPHAHTKKIRKHILKRRYGITPEEYDALLLKQGGHCALCDRTPDKERYKRLNVDHCHETQVIRGLLCTRCNSALGALGDNEEGLLRALKYIAGGI